MNQYQKHIIENNLKFELWDENHVQLQNIELDIKNGIIQLKQNEDITITKYMLSIFFNPNDIKSAIKIDYYERGNYKELKSQCDSSEKLVIDFNYPIEKIKIRSLYNIFDSFEMKINYIWADKEVYYEKVKQLEIEKMLVKKKELAKLINPEHKTGRDIVNIYWDLISNEVDRTEINLYLLSNFGERQIGKYVEKDCQFKSVGGLAFGQYVYEIIELDKDGNELARTEKVSFSLSAKQFTHTPNVRR